MRIVRTKNTVTIDSQTNSSSKVYFLVTEESKNYERPADFPGTISFMVRFFKEVSVENGVPTLITFGGTNADYKRSTFKNLFGNLTLSQFEDQIPDLALSQIAFNGQKFWGVTENDLEIYEGEVIFQ